MLSPHPHMSIYLCIVYMCVCMCIFVQDGMPPPYTTHKSRYESRDQRWNNSSARLVGKPVPAHLEDQRARIIHRADCRRPPRRSVLLPPPHYHPVQATVSLEAFLDWVPIHRRADTPGVAAD